MNDHLRGLVAVMVVLSTVGGVAMIGPHVGGPVGDASPVSQAAAYPGQCAVDTFAWGLQVTISGNLPASCGPSEEEALQQEDANETEKEIFSTASGVNQQSETLLSGVNNHLQDTSTIAKLEAKNAYIRALNNGTTEAEARAAARGAIADYYADRQITVKEAWNGTQATYENLAFTADDTPGVNQEFTGFGYDQDLVFWNDEDNVTVEGSGTESLTLVNSSSTQSLVLNLEFDDADSGTDMVDLGMMQNGQMDTQGTSMGVTYQRVNPPNSNYEALRVLDFNDNPYRQRWNDIEAQNDAVQAEVDTFINNTYDSYQQGEINNSDLIDPYLASREYSPDQEFGTWSLRTLTSMGMAPPSNLSEFGDMTIQYDGEQLNGILLSDGLPQDDAFETGSTYHTDSLGGSQFLMDPYSEQLHELDGSFTVTNATTMDGETLDTVNYTVQDYTTANTEEYQALISQLKNTTEAINDRQDELRSGEGGGIGLPPLGLGIPDLLVYGGIAIAVLWLFSREDEKY